MATGYDPQWEEQKFTIYVEQISSGSTANQAVVYLPGNPNGFGDLIVVDWAVHLGPERDSKVVGRVEGQIIKCSQQRNFWHNVYSIVFRDDKFKGSSLELRGTWEVESAIEWPIVGRTGLFKSAQGSIDVKILSQVGTIRIMQLDVDVFYRSSTSQAPAGK